MSWFSDRFSLPNYMRVDYVQPSDDGDIIHYRDPTFFERLADANRDSARRILGDDTYMNWYDDFIQLPGEAGMNDAPRLTQDGQQLDTYGYAEYLSGLFSSVGAENALNRQYNSAEAQLQREWSSKEAERNRQWQEQMSNSAYTRAAADLRNAGLNPLLAVGGMSTTPAGAMASGSSASYQTGGGDTMSDILQALASSASALSDVLTFFIPKVKAKAK